MNFIVICQQVAWWPGNDFQFPISAWLRAVSPVTLASGERTRGFLLGVIWKHIYSTLYLYQNSFPPAGFKGAQVGASHLAFSNWYRGCDWQLGDRARGTAALQEAVSKCRSGFCRWGSVRLRPLSLSLTSSPPTSLVMHAPLLHVFYRVRTEPGLSPWVQHGHFLILRVALVLF